MTKLKKYIPYIILFLFIIAYNMLLVPNNMDEIWNYGFSYAIRLGEIPYKDFNMVLPPLYAFLMTIPLLIYNNYLSFIIFHSLTMTVFFYLLFKMYDKNTYLLMLLTFIFVPLIYPTYNSFILFLLILIIYLEKSKIKQKDYLIGLLVACSILTKQSIGIFYIIPSIMLIKKKEINIIHRFIGFLLPNILFLIYLLITKSIYQFIDLCFLGLFDFTGNSQGVRSSLIIFLIILFISIFIILKNKKNIVNYYLILSYSIFLPILDSLHLFYVFLLFLILLYENCKIPKLKYEMLFFVSLFFIVIMQLKNNIASFKEYPNNINHFNYKYISEEKCIYSEEIIKFVKENDVVIYNDDAYFYKIAADKKIDYLDIVNHGNHGYNGTNKLISIIEENKNKIFMIRKSDEKRILHNKTQLDKDGYYYIVNNLKKIGTIRDFDLYTNK